MEGSPYRKFSISRRKGAILGPGPENSIAGNQAGIQRPVSCLGSGGIQYLSIFPQQFAPYCSISSSNSGNNLCTQVNRSCSFSAGLTWAGHRSNRGLVLLGPLILVEEGKLWASDDVLETVEPGALMFPEEDRPGAGAWILQDIWKHPYLLFGSRGKGNDPDINRDSR
ncbi:hypothetical protein F2Q68_00025551 [Brassica cretica]|uniref:Uncharacterized protein n=1 Tax=Brassica cretica TaxID=69181 RepID=A0A8S9IBH1_BRACR|nr:hypothetical protein F2Q68_00025551 [Brassica cretica]